MPLTRNPIILSILLLSFAFSVICEQHNSKTARCSQENEEQKEVTRLRTKSSPSLLAIFRSVLNDTTILVQSLTTKFVPQETEGLLETLSTRITSTLVTFATELSNAGEDILEDLLRSILKQINRVKNELLHLAQNLDDQFYNAVQQFNESLINQSDNIDAWANNIKHNLRTFNNSRIYKRGCQVVDELINVTTDELEQCCNVTIKPIVSICRSFQTLLANALQVLASVMHRMQVCLEDKDSYKDYMIPCVKLAYDEVRILVNEAAEMRQRMETVFPFKILYSSCCLSIALVHIEQRQNTMVNEIYSN